MARNDMSEPVKALYPNAVTAGDSGRTLVTNPKKRRGRGKPSPKSARLAGSQSAPQILSQSAPAGGAVAVAVQEAGAYAMAPSTDDSQTSAPASVGFAEPATSPAKKVRSASPIGRCRHPPMPMAYLRRRGLPSAHPHPASS